LTNGKRAAGRKSGGFAVRRGRAGQQSPARLNILEEISGTLVWNWYNSMMYTPLSGDPAQTVYGVIYY
jgi:hypothetical protein